MPTRAEQALAFFQKSLGLTPAQAAGLVGNLQQESGADLNPTLLGDNGASFGAFQHQGPRRRALNEFAASRGVQPSDFQTQLEFAANEFRTTERRAFDRLRSATTPQEAARAAVSFFRPSDPRTENRVNNAIRLAGGTAPTVRRVATVPVSATAAPAAPAAAAAPTTPPTAPAGLLAGPGGSQTMADGNAPGGVGGFVQGLLADPTFNLGIGLLAAGGPSTTPVSLGQALAQGVQFAGRREQEGLKNQAARQQLLAAQRQREARANLSQALPGLLSNLPPEQRAAVGLLAEAAPAQAVQGLLSNMLPAQRRPNSVIEQAQFVHPNDIEAQRKFVTDNVKQAGGTSAQLDAFLKGLQIQKIQREEATATRTDTEARSANVSSVNMTIKHLLEAADLNKELSDTYLASGQTGPDAVRFSIGSGALAARALGLGGDAAARTAGLYDRFKKLSNETILQEAGKMTGQATNQLREFIQNSQFGVGIAPDANRKVIADNLERALATADRIGAAVPDRDKVAARIQQLRSSEAAAAGGAAAGQPATPPAPATSASPSTEAESGPRRFSNEAAVRRAFERGRIKAGDEVIVNGRRFIVRDQ